MKILFVYTSLSMGGIQTLILRFMRALRQRGHQADLLISGTPHRTDLFHQMSQEGQIIYTQNKFFRQSFLFDEPAGKLASDYDYIFCMNGYSMLMGLSIKNRLKLKATLAVGVYFSREYCFPVTSRLYNWKLTEYVFKQLPEPNIFFMDEISRVSHTQHLSKDFSCSPVVPLAVDTQRFSTIHRKPNRHKLVSIGRLTAIKTYNFHMINVVKELMSRGHNIEYHIWGNGEDYVKLKDYIQACGMDEHVFLHGELSYPNMEPVLSDAFVFIGMGTALIEAAAAGVPCLTAIESNSTATSYGFFHEVGHSNIGEKIENQIEYSMVDKLENLLSVNYDDYLSICRTTQKQAQYYSIESVLNQFIATLSKTISFEIAWKRTYELIDMLDRGIWRLIKIFWGRYPYRGF